MTDQSVSVIVRHIIGNNDTLQTQSNHGDQDLRLRRKVSIERTKYLLNVITTKIIYKRVFFSY